MNDAIFSKVAAIRLAVAFNLPFTGAGAGRSWELGSTLAVAAEGRRAGWSAEGLYKCHSIALFATERN